MEGGKKMTAKEKQSKSVSWKLGYDAGLNKPNEINCNYAIFSSPEKTKEWEAGNQTGKIDKVIKNLSKTV